jgi:hypothetical protein
LAILTTVTPPTVDTTPVTVTDFEAPDRFATVRVAPTSGAGPSTRTPQSPPDNFVNVFIVHL